MFKVMQNYTPREGEAVLKKAVVDEERQVYIRFVCQILNTPGQVMICVHSGGVVPYEVEFSERDGCKFAKILDFGSSRWARSLEEIEPYIFSDSAERERLLTLAIEAMFSYGTFYNPDYFDKNRYFVLADGKTYSINDVS